MTDIQAPYSLPASRPSTRGRQSPPGRTAARPRTVVFDMARLPWQATDNPGLWLKPVRHDDARGLYLGLVKFAAFTRSGLHQHQGVATSFVLEGGLTDYHGSLLLHEVGINLKGATHDAIAYADTVLCSRLEGPVLYRPGGDISGVHAGSRHAAFTNPDPHAAPEINVPADTVPAYETGIPGIRRQMLFDYAGTGSAHRMVQLRLTPGAQARFKASALTELWVRAGTVQVGRTSAHANHFIVCEPGAPVSLSCEFGAMLIAWAEGPEQGSGGSLFGF